MLKSLSILIAIVAGFWFWQNFGPGKPLQACAEPILYSIGGFDRRFGLSSEQFLSAVEEAEDLWEEAVGQKELFTYSPEDGELSVNLVYDSRQAVTQALSNLESNVEEGQEGYENLQARYGVLKAKYAELEKVYDTRVESLEQSSDSYEAKVVRWNAGPKNSKSEYESLEAEREELDRETTEVEAIEAELNAMVREINVMVDRLNRLAHELNITVEKYNKLGASRGETFTGGVYENDAEGARINIYEFQSHEKLVRILAHELGHALGLDHSDDPQAIMYYLNDGSVGKLGAADIQLIKNLCLIN